MEINWFTVIAQIVNFLILVYLLKRFLYKPVLKAIDERERKIASQIEDAAKNKSEAKKEQDLFRQKNEDFNKERAAKLNEAYEEVDSEKQRMFEEVRKESTALRTKYEDSLKEEEKELKDKIKRKTKNAVFAIAGKTLSDLANTNLEEQVINVFIEKITNLDKVEIAKFKESLNNNKKPITIKSAFEFSESSKQELGKAIESITERKNDFEYRLEPELVSGIEIETSSFQMSWNIESYLDSLKMDSITKENENATD